MTDENKKLILITDFIEQKWRKEKELEFYMKELDDLQRKIGYLQNEVTLTNTIINLIKGEQVHDIQEEFLKRYDNQLIRKDDEWK